MQIAITAILWVLSIVLAAVVVLAIPGFIALMIWDVVSRKDKLAPASEHDSVWHSLEASFRRIRIERGFARAFVILGGAFWGIAAFAGLYEFRETGAGAAAMAAAIPLFAALVTLVIGWYWERFAAIALAVGSAVVVYWGVAMQFEMGVWVLIGFFLLGPMLTAAVLFWMARRETEALEIRLSQPEVALVYAEGPRGS